MARPLRIQAADTHYHVGGRGVDRAPVFLTDEDREHFLRLLAEVVEHYGWRCYGYCLMRNHYHLAVITPRPNLGAGMARLNQFYAQWFNHRHDRVGHLFEQRYWSRVLTSESHVVAVALYIAENPVRAGLCARPEHWRWSSARALLGLSPPPRFLDVGWARSLLDPVTDV
jgi:putative transposase